MLCYYATGDKDRMKKGFSQLCETPLEVEDEDKYLPVSDDSMANLILEAIKNDDLRKIERARRHEAEHAILTAAKLISPVIEETFSAGYNWCVDTIKLSAHSQLANDLEINKAVMFLRQKNFTDAIETLKCFEKQENKVASTAATNLSFLYFLQVLTGKNISQSLKNILRFTLSSFATAGGDGPGGEVRGAGHEVRLLQSLRLRQPRQLPLQPRGPGEG